MRAVLPREVTGQEIYDAIQKVKLVLDEEGCVLGESKYTRFNYNYQGVNKIKETLEQFTIHIYTKTISKKGIFKKKIYCVVETDPCIYLGTFHADKKYREFSISFIGRLVVGNRNAYHRVIMPDEMERLKLVFKKFLEKFYAALAPATV